MAGKPHLRRVRSNTVINTTSKKQEEALIRALHRVETGIAEKFKVSLSWKQQWRLVEIVDDLKALFPDVDFNQPLSTSTMKPDGGILSIVDANGKSHPILITERKNQGTNDLRKAEGKEKQAKGNAVERLGKNVIGLKTAMLGSGIFPFVCFGDGCDFADSSSILDRVVTIAMFGHLRKIYMAPQGGNGEFLRGSFYFRENQWTEDEMFKIMPEVATRAVHHYVGRYGEAAFISHPPPPSYS
jgi:type II restriction enzyme